MIKIANAPCSWGALEFDLAGAAPGYVQVLNEIAETGYAGTELGDWGFMPTDPQKLATEIHSRNLKLLGAFVPVAMKKPEAHQAGIDVAVKTARLMAAVEGDLPFIVLADENGSIPERTQNAGRVRPEMGLTTAEWQIFAEGAMKVAAGCEKRKPVYEQHFHHHCAGYVETPAEIETLMGLTDPSMLGLVFDCGHYRFRRRRSTGRFEKVWQTSMAFPLQRSPAGSTYPGGKGKAGLLPGSEWRRVLRIRQRQCQLPGFDGRTKTDWL